MKRTFSSSTLLLAIMMLSLAVFLPALQSGVGGGGQSNVGGGGGGTPGGANTQVQFNNNGAFGGSSQFTFTPGTSAAVVINGSGSSASLQVGNSLGNFGGAGGSSLVLGGNGSVVATQLVTASPAQGGTTGYVSIATGGGLITPAIQTAANCSSSASPAVCTSAAAGSVAIAAAATTEVVNTTAVTANSQIILTRDDSLGTKLSVTCNTATVMGEMKVSARTGGTSFTITVQTAPATNPGCVSYWILN